MRAAPGRVSCTGPDHTGPPGSETSLPFLNARPNLLNVAISRAKHHFVCLGHAAVLARGPRSRLLVDSATTLSPAAFTRDFHDTAKASGQAD